MSEGLRRGLAGVAGSEAAPPDLNQCSRGTFSKKEEKRGKTIQMMTSDLHLRVKWTWPLALGEPNTSIMA